MSGAWRLTIVVPHWLPVVYLAAGCVLWLPCEWLAWRDTTPRTPFWPALRRAVHGRPLRVIVPIVAWPLGLWELFR